jgi:large subunit ribosomal protein L9e
LRFLPEVRKQNLQHGCWNFLEFEESISANLSFLSQKTVEVEINARVIKVTGPRGSLTRNFKHLSMDLRKVENSIRVDVWFANRKQLATVRTVISHIDNMFVGVTRGFIYKMRFVYSHFPINVTLAGDIVEIRNFLGEKRVRKVKLLEGVKYVRSNDVKDQIELSGNDIALVSLTAAQIQGQTNVRNKDLRKFLDGIYVSEKGPMPEQE